MTLMPNGQAAVCKAATSGFDSHRRLFVSEVLIVLGQRRTTPQSTGRCGVFRVWIVTKARETATRLAQLVEHQAVNLAVTGSTPVPHRRLRNLLLCERNRRESVTM